MKAGGAWLLHLTVNVTLVGIIFFRGTKLYAGLLSQVVSFAALVTVDGLSA